MPCIAAHSDPLNGNKIEQLNELGCCVEQMKDVGVYHFQAKTNHDPQHRDLSLLVQPAPQVTHAIRVKNCLLAQFFFGQNYDIRVTESGFEPNHLQIFVDDQVWWQWNSRTAVCSVIQVSYILHVLL